MNKEKLIEVLTNFRYKNGSYELRDISTEHSLMVDEYSITTVDCLGGYEGAGEEHWVVLEAKHPINETEYWKIPGWYQSYDGSTLEIENVYRVYPKEKTVRVWEKN